MSVVSDIARSWRHPRQVMRGLLSVGQREDRALVILMLGCALVMLSTLPRLVREAELGIGGAVRAELGSVILAWLFIAPLFLYVLGAATHVVAKLFRGRGTWYGARLSLFWALLAASPFWLIYGLTLGYFGVEAAIVQALGLVAFVMFLFLWAASFYEAEFGRVDEVGAGE